MKHFLLILLIIISLFLTFLLKKTIPTRYFEPYHLTLDSVWPKNETEQEYRVNINRPFEPDLILHHNINQPGNSIEYHHNNSLRVIYIFGELELFISKKLYFADINQDGSKEILFLSAKGARVDLNILEHNPVKHLFSPIAKIPIDTVKLHNGNPDVINNCITTFGSTVFFDLTAGYAIQPRRLFKFDTTRKILSSSSRNSLNNESLEAFHYNDTTYILSTHVRATGNTISHSEAIELSSSRNKDTLEMYESIKHLEYSYGDFSSYVLLYDNNLQFAFEPIDYFGWSNYTKSTIVEIESSPHILSITNTDKGEDSVRCITICNLKGELIKKTPLPINFTDVYTDNNLLIFFGENRLFLYTKQIEPIDEISNITSTRGFWDVNNDNRKEFIAFNKNDLLVYTNDFKHKSTFTITQEFAPIPDSHGISTQTIEGKTSFLFNTRLFYYLFRYNKNPYSFLEIPFSFLIFLFWYALLTGLIRINSYRHKKDKQRLEESISRRTAELVEKNKELDTQKKEIQSQAKELSIQNINLEKLNQFKRMLTNTLVHDLKNPLSQIRFLSSDKIIRQLTGRMLLLITNMLDVEKYEQTSLVVHKDAIILKDIVDEVIENQNSSLQEKNIQIEMTLEDIMVYADRSLLLRVIENLLSNAIRFSPHNQSITLEASLNDNQIVFIQIGNKGKSIPEESLETIFEKFQQADPLIESYYQTTGLGLTFCKMAIEAHGHHITAKNKPNEVVFSFCLDGSLLSSVKAYKRINLNPIELTSVEKELLSPWIIQLKSIEIYQVSDILNIVNQIPNHSDNVAFWKQRIIDAVFASNVHLFSKTIAL